MIKKAFICIPILLLSISICYAQTLIFAVAADEPPLSSEVDGTSVGIIPEITSHLFSLVPQYEAKFVALPWPRAQLSVEKGAAEGFVTYPSGKRKQYALFTKGIANKIDFGYLIYPKDHERRIELEEAQSFQDLKSFKAVIQSGVGWEQDSIPDYIKRVPANNLDIMTHLLFFRRQGDFFIMPPSQAMFYAKKFGYQNNVAYRRAAFISDAEIPFSVGLRKNLENAPQIIEELDLVLASKEFKLGAQKIIDRYR